MLKVKIIFYSCLITSLISCQCEPKKESITTRQKNTESQTKTQLPESTGYPPTENVVNKKEKLKLPESAEKIMQSYLSSSEECKIEISSNDQMKFLAKDSELKTLKVDKKCKKFYIHLKHIGNLDSSIMGHNIVITKDQDLLPVSAEALKAGKEKGYIPDDPRVIAHSHVLLGGGEDDFKDDYIEIDTSKFENNASYKFFCSFPGHIGMMQGSITF